MGVQGEQLNTIINAPIKIKDAQAALTLHGSNMHECQLHSLVYSTIPLVIQLKFRLPWRIN